MRSGAQEVVEYRHCAAGERPDTLPSPPRRRAWGFRTAPSCEIASSHRRKCFSECRAAPSAPAGSAAPATLGVPAGRAGTAGLLSESVFASDCRTRNSPDAARRERQSPTPKLAFRLRARNAKVMRAAKLAGAACDATRRMRWVLW